MGNRTPAPGGLAPALKKFFREHWVIAIPVVFLPTYLLSFFALEKAAPTAGYYVCHLPIDDKIPFLEGFVIFYCLWFVLLVSVGFMLFLTDDRGFLLYMLDLWVGFAVCLVFCHFFPNGQDLRPAVFPRDNVFSRIVGRLYAADTNTNVFPSMHVVGALACCYGIRRSRALAYPWLRTAVVVSTVLINLSTVFIKQHSVLDVLGGLALSLILYLFFYRFLDRRLKPYPHPPLVATRYTRKSG